MRYLFIIFVAAFCIFNIGCHKTNVAKNIADTSICGRYAGTLYNYEVDVAGSHYDVIIDTTYADTMIVANTNNADTAFRASYRHTLFGLTTSYNATNQYGWSEPHGEEWHRLDFYPANDSVSEDAGVMGETQYTRFYGRKI